MRIGTIARAVRLGFRCSLLALLLVHGSCGTYEGGGTRSVQLVGGSMRPGKCSYALARSSDFVALPRSPASLPTSVDLRRDGIIPPVQNQHMNSCVGWALGYTVVSAVEARHWRNQGACLDITDPDNWFSPDFLYAQRDSKSDLEGQLAGLRAQGVVPPDQLLPSCNERDGEVCFMRPERALEILNVHGCCRYRWMCSSDPTDDTFRGCGPVESLDVDTDSRPPARLTLEGAGWFRPRCFVRFGALDQFAQGTIDRMKSWLHTQGTPIAIVVKMTSGWVTFQGENRMAVEGVATSCAPETRSVCLDAGGDDLGSQHMMTIVGYDSSFPSRLQAPDLPDDGQGSFLVVNHWGTKWGDQGYMWIPCSELERIWIGGYGLIRSPTVIWGGRADRVCTQNNDGKYVQGSADGNDVHVNLLSDPDWKALRDARKDPKNPNLKECYDPGDSDLPVPGGELPGCATSQQDALKVRVTACPLDLPTSTREGRVGGAEGGSVIDSADWFQFTVPAGASPALSLAVNKLDGMPNPDVAWRLYGRGADGQLVGLGEAVAGGAPTSRSLCPGLYFLQIMPADEAGDIALPYALTLSSAGVGAGPCVGLGAPGAGATDRPVCTWESAALTGRSLHRLELPADSSVTVRLAGGTACAKLQLATCLVAGHTARFQSACVVPSADGAAALVLHTLPPSPTDVPLPFDCAPTILPAVGPVHAWHSDANVLYLGVRPLGPQDAADPACDTSSYTLQIEVCCDRDAPPAQAPPPCAVTRMSSEDVAGIWRFGAGDAFLLRRAGDARSQWIVALDAPCTEPAIAWTTVPAGVSVEGATWSACDAPGSAVACADMLLGPLTQTTGDARHLRLVVPARLTGDAWISLRGPQGAAVREFDLRILREYSLGSWPTIDRPDAGTDGNNTPGSARPLTLDGAPLAERIGVYPGASGAPVIDWYDFFSVRTEFTTERPGQVTIRLTGKDVRSFLYLSVWDHASQRWVAGVNYPIPTGSPDVLEVSVSAGPRVQVVLENWHCFPYNGDDSFDYQIQAIRTPVPDVVGLSRAEVIAALVRGGFPCPTLRWDPEIPLAGDPTAGRPASRAPDESVVVAQFPPAGSLLATGAEVVLTVHRPPFESVVAPEEAMPDLRGMTKTAAWYLLYVSGWYPKGRWADGNCSVLGEADYAPDGAIVEDQWPAPGARRPPHHVGSPDDPKDWKRVEVWIRR